MNADQRLSAFIGGQSWYATFRSATAVTLASPFVDQNNLLPPADQTTPFPIAELAAIQKRKSVKLVRYAWEK